MLGWVKLNRGEDTMALIRKYPNAYILLTVTALRARRTSGPSIHGLSMGEALLGDHASYGLSRQAYRTALNQLTRWGFITIRPTSKGTIARLTNTTVFDINMESEQPSNQPSNRQQPANSAPPSNLQPTTNKNDKNEKRKEESSIDRVERMKNGGMLQDG